MGAQHEDKGCLWFCFSPPPACLGEWFLGSLNSTKWSFASFCFFFLDEWSASVEHCLEACSFVHLWNAGEVGEQINLPGWENKVDQPSSVCESYSCEPVCSFIPRTAGVNLWCIVSNWLFPMHPLELWEGDGEEMGILALKYLLLGEKCVWIYRTSLALLPTCSRLGRYLGSELLSGTEPK